MNDIQKFFNFLSPIHDLWQAVVEQPLAHFLTYLYDHLQTVPVIHEVGAYGVAIVILTIIIRLALAPLQQFQLVTQRKTMVEQRKLAPQVGELRKKFKGEPQKLNAEMMKLYQEHGVNPLGGLVGCLPLIIQIPILTALYYVFTGFAAHSKVSAPFLFVPDLNTTPMHHVIMVAGVLPLPWLAYLIFPLFAALTTLVQSRMLMMPPPANPTEQELQTLNMQRTMAWLSPLMIGYFALQVPAGLGLYWFIGNCVSIIQQYFVVGWGSLLPKRGASGSDPVIGTKGPGSGPKPGPKPTLKPVPQNGRPKRPRK